MTVNDRKIRGQENLAGMFLSTGQMGRERPSIFSRSRALASRGSVRRVLGRLSRPW